MSRILKDRAPSPIPTARPAEKRAAIPTTDGETTRGPRAASFESTSMAPASDAPATAFRRLKEAMPSLKASTATLDAHATAASQLQRWNSELKQG